MCQTCTLSVALEQCPSFAYVVFSFFLVSPAHLSKLSLQGECRDCRYGGATISMPFAQWRAHHCVAPYWRWLRNNRNADKGVLACAGLNSSRGPGQYSFTLPSSSIFGDIPRELASGRICFKKFSHQTNGALLISAIDSWQISTRGSPTKTFKYG